MKLSALEMARLAHRRAWDAWWCSLMGTVIAVGALGLAVLALLLP